MRSPNSPARGHRPRILLRTLSVCGTLLLAGATSAAVAAVAAGALAGAVGGNAPARVSFKPSGADSRTARVESAAPLAEPILRTSPAPVGTTFDDLVRQGVVADPRGGTRELAPANVDPGTPPEGDDIGWAAFTHDGAQVLLTNRDTNNITVFDWATRQAIANVPAGGYPSEIALTDDYAVITCPFENRVCILDLHTFAIVGFAPTGEQPWVVRISPDQTTAYVGCDISNTLEVIDIASAARVRTIQNFPMYLNSWTTNSENGRISVQFADFELTADGAYAVIADGEVSTTFYFFNTATGAIDYTITGIPNGRALALSGDRTKAVVANLSDPVSVWQIDLATHAVSGQVSIPGYQLGYLCIGANQDGSKAFIGISNNKSAIVRFATSDAHTFSETYTPFWIGTSPDHAWTISGQYRFTVIDYASESILGQYEGVPQYSGAVSPVGLRAVALNPFGFEGLHFYDFTGGAPSYLGGTIAGLDPEGDCPHRVTITPDGSRAIVTNVLSDNAVVVDLSIPAVVATIPVGSRPQDVSITPDSRWAVVGSGGSSVKILDLFTNMVVADVATGNGAATVSISPDGTKAFVGNSASNTVSIIALSGPDSHRVAEVPVGEIGVLWAAYGVYSDVRTSPDNRYCLVATSFDDKVKVIDSRTNTVVANVTVGDFPLQIAFDADGSHAIVTNYQSNNYSVLRVNGQLTYVVGTYAHGNGPMRLDNDPVHNKTAIGNYGSKTVSLVDPETGALLSTKSYASYGNIDQVIVDENGEPIVLTTSGSGAPGYLVRATEVVSLPAAPACFDYSPVSHTAVVAEPGPDWFTVVNYASSGAPEVVDISNGRVGLLLAPTPNPVGGEGDASLPFVLVREGTVRLSVTDAAGRAIVSIPVGRLSAGRYVERWTPPAGGVYFVSLVVDGRAVGTKKVVVVGR